MLVDQFGPRRVILASMALMTVATALVSRVDGPWQFIALYGVVSAVGYTGCGILPVSIHVSRWFPEERGFVSAVAACGFSVGHLAFTQVAARTAAVVGWRQTYVLLASVLAASVAVFAFALRDAPVPADGTAPENPARRRRGRAEPAWNVPRPRGRHEDACLLGPDGGAHGLRIHRLPHDHAPRAPRDGPRHDTRRRRERGESLGGGQHRRHPGRRHGGGRTGTRTALVLTYGLRAAALFYLPLVHEPWQLYLFAGLFGATFFTTAPLSSTLVGQLFGPAHHGAIFGASNLFHHSAGALGSYAGGLVFDITGSYRPMFRVAALVVVGSALVTSLARRPATPREQSRGHDPTFSND